jgi:hypothetical protein
MERCSCSPPPPSPSDDLSRPLLLLSWRRSGVSRVRKPLAPARALLGRFHCGQSCCPYWATVSTRRLRAVNPDLAPLALSSRGRGRRGRAGVASLFSIKSWPWWNPVCRCRGECSCHLSIMYYLHSQLLSSQHHPRSPRLQAGDRSDAPVLLLRRRPLKTLAAPFYCCRGVAVG